MKTIMNVVIGVIVLVFSSVVFAQCAVGWVLKHQQPISVTERLCVYEKNGVQQKHIVNGLCPMTPPGC